MAPSFDLSSVPLLDASAQHWLRFTRWLLFGFAVVIIALLLVFYWLDSMRYGASQSDWLLVPIAVVVPMGVACDWVLRMLGRFPIRLDVDARGVHFAYGSGALWSLAWGRESSKLTWIDGRGVVRTRWTPRFPTTHVRSDWRGVITALPEQAFDEVLAFARTMGRSVERLPDAAKSMYRGGSLAYRIS